MLKVLLQNKGRVFLGIVLIMLFGFVRFFERSLFYDPFVHYFENDFLNLPLPSFDYINLFVALAFRYGVNMVISLALLYVIFKEKEMISFCFALYIFFFIILFASFFSVIYFYGDQNNLILFYIRRFLIQPLFVLLFIPAFYYQKKSASNGAF